MEENNVVLAIIGVITSFISGLFGFMIAWGKTKKDLTLHDRKLLSSDEQAFRAELRAELEQNRKEIASLRSEVASLRKLNLALEIENKKLQIKIDELTTEVKGRLEKDGRKEEI